MSKGAITTGWGQNSPNLMPEPKQKKRRGCLIPLLIIALIFGGSLVFVLLTISEDPETYRKKSILASELELTIEQENSMLEIFDQCGIGEIVSAEQFQAGDSKTSYHLADSETAKYHGADYAIVVWMDNDTKTIQSIYFHDQDIYVDGVVVSQITDYYLSSDERDSYRVSAQLAVNQVLNYPDTAEYPAMSGWAFGIQDGLAVVQSSVTAQNAFGVKATYPFQVKFSGQNIVSLILDGTEYIEQ